MTPFSQSSNDSIKWKPPSENSIDFKLVLRFPPSRSQPSIPDFQAKPFFALHVYCGEERGVPRYEPYDEMYVEDEEWERCVISYSMSKRESVRFALQNEVDWRTN